jgi:hypothetical protein
LDNAESDNLNIIREAKALKIENLKLENKEGTVRAAATVLWEDCDRPGQELYFETDAEFSDGFSCSPHAFMVGCILPAMRYGEKRIFMDAELCPELRDGLITVMSWMRHWYYGQEKALVEIEAKKQSSPLPQAKQRAGMFFSGGIDSLATLRANRLNYPLEHPGSIKDGLVVYGLEVYEEEKFDHVLNSISEIARDAGIRLIPVYTNIRNVGPEDNGEFWSDFWLNEYMGAAFSAIAHTFSRGLNRAIISSCHDIPNIVPYGSHPMINPDYSSADLSIEHFGITLSRFEKTRLISNWDIALKHLRVCNNSSMYESQALNCGECEKCLRTKAALLALGALGRTSAFANKEISPERLKTTVRLNKMNVAFYEELLAPLSKSGHQELVDVVKQKISEYKWRQRIKEPIRKLDDKYLKGTLVKLKGVAYEKGLR